MRNTERPYQGGERGGQWLQKGWRRQGEQGQGWGPVGGGKD